MSQQQKGLEKLLELLRAHVLVHLQDPFVLRIVVISLIGVIGIGGMGTPLYFKLQTLYEKYYEQQVRVVLIKEHQDVKQTFAAYKQRLSPNTEFIEWVRDIREINRQNDLTILNLQPILVGSKDPEAVRQLTIDMTVAGTYLNILKLFGRLEYSKVRINVREFKITPISSDKYLSRIKLGILMQPTAAKKNIKDKIAAAQTAVAVSSATAVSTSTVTAVSTAAVPAVSTAAAPVASTGAAPAASTAAAQAQKPKPAATPTSSSKFRTEATPATVKGGTAPASKFSTPSQSQKTAPSSKFTPPAPAPPPKRKKAPQTPPAQPQAAVPAALQPPAVQALGEDGELLPD